MMQPTNITYALPEEAKLTESVCTKGLLQSDRYYAKAGVNPYYMRVNKCANALGRNISDMTLNIDKMIGLTSNPQTQGELLALKAYMTGPLAEYIGTIRP